MDDAETGTFCREIVSNPRSDVAESVNLKIHAPRFCSLAFLRGVTIHLSET